MLVEKLQHKLQQQYDLAIPYRVEHFVSHDAELARQLTNPLPLSTQSSTQFSMDSSNVQLPEETVFICQDEYNLEFTLYLDHDVFLAASQREENEQYGSQLQALDSICTVVEGVSHAVCLLWHAHHDRQLRALDLELQAEIDKYMLLSSVCSDTASRDQLRYQLFDNAQFTSEPGSTLYERYKAASDFAARYCKWLEQTFPGPSEQRAMSQELARFYRLSGSAKFERIRRLH